MDEETKKRLREDAIRDTRIVDRITEFGDFCDRLHRMTSSQQLRDVLAEAVHKIERKEGELNLGRITGRAGTEIARSRDARRREIGEESAAIEKINEGKRILSEIDNIAGRITIRAGRSGNVVNPGARFNYLVMVNRLLADLEKKNTEMANKRADERERVLRPIADNIITNVGQYAGGEDDSVELLRAISQKALEYSEKVVPYREFEKWYKLSKWGIWKKYVEKRLEDDVVDFHKTIVAEIGLLNVDKVRDMLLGELGMLRQEDSAGATGLSNETKTSAALARIRQTFGGTASSSSLDYNKVIKNINYPRRDVLVDQKVLELELIKQAKEIAVKIHKSIESLNRALA